MEQFLGNNPSTTNGTFTLSISVTGPASVVQSLYKYAKLPGLSFTRKLAQSEDKDSNETKLNKEKSKYRNSSIEGCQDKHTCGKENHFHAINKYHNEEDTDDEKFNEIEQFEDALEFSDDDDDLSHINQGPMKVFRTLDIGDGDTAWVIDNVIGYKTAKLWTVLFNDLTHWNGHVFNHMNYSKAHPNIDWNYGSAPWSQAVDINFFTKTPTWTKLQPMIEELLKQKVQPQHGQVDILRALDAVPPTSDKYCAPNRYVLTIFLTNMWNLNNYGQVTFYSHSHNPNITGTPRLEVTESVHPHAYRALLWPSCHPVLFRAPCVNYFNQLTSLHIWLSPSEGGSQAISPSLPPAPSKDEQRKEFADFFSPPPDGVVDYKSHLVRSFHDGDVTRQVNIFDGLFTPEETKNWKRHLLKTRPVGNVFDTSSLEDHDNVQWTSNYQVGDFMKTSMWPRLLDLCRFVSNHSDWHPYDVSLNYVRSGDHTRIHPDSEPHQDELTMVMYLNEGLTPSDYGETTFFVRKPHDGVHEFTGDGGELYDAIGVVTPKFGRVAIFANDIEHSAHPPSLRFLGGRYTFALKVSKNRHLAFVKMAFETMEGLPLDDAMEELNTKLMDGELDHPSLISTATLENLVGETSTKIRQNMQRALEDIKKMLLKE